MVIIIRCDDIVLKVYFESITQYELSWFVNAIVYNASS